MPSAQVHHRRRGEVPAELLPVAGQHRAVLGDVDQVVEPVGERRGRRVELGTDHPRPDGRDRGPDVAGDRRDLPDLEPQHPLVARHRLVGDGDLAGLPAAQQAPARPGPRRRRAPRRTGGRPGGSRRGGAGATSPAASRPARRCRAGNRSAACRRRRSSGCAPDASWSPCCPLPSYRAEPDSQHRANEPEEQGADQRTGGVRHHVAEGRMRSGSSRPWTVSTGERPAKPSAVQSRQVQRGQSSEASSVTGATITRVHHDLEPVKVIRAGKAGTASRSGAGAPPRHWPAGRRAEQGHASSTTSRRRAAPWRAG